MNKNHTNVLDVLSNIMIAANEAIAPISKATAKLIAYLIQYMIPYPIP
jgi:hypothetical protein